MASYIKKDYVIYSFLIIYLCLCGTKGQAQVIDRIVKKDSTELWVTIVSTADDSITYRLYGQPKDSVYSIAKSAVQKVILRNGAGNYYPKLGVYNTRGTVKQSKFSPIYVDAAAGAWFTNHGTWALADLNIGYRFNEKVAIGLSRIAMSNYSISASGIGIQCRFTPERNNFFKLEFGYITNAGSIDRSGLEVYTYLPQNSSNIYFRMGAAVRIYIFTLGINYVNSGSISFQVSNTPNGSTRTWSGNMGFLCPQLGIALPLSKKAQKP
jgi:hypothetical protein